MKPQWMQNDVDLIRAILTRIRDRDDLNPRKIGIPGRDPLEVNRHAERLYEDGYIDGIRVERDPGEGDPVFARDLTSAGHAFPGALESEEVWKQIKSALTPAQIGSLTIGKLAGLAGELAEKAIRKKLGLE